MTEPTDAEIVAVMRDGYNCRYNDEQDHIDFARAVLAKWGTPAPVEVEPYGWHYWNIAGTSVFHLGRSNKLDADIDASRKHPDVHHVVPLYTTPQPTQAQAVNQADRQFIVRLAEDFAEECVTAGFVTTKAASYGRLMNEALSTHVQAGIGG